MAYSGEKSLLVPWLDEKTPPTIVPWLGFEPATSHIA